jgi:hypothetical protein
MREDISAQCVKAAFNSLWIYSRVGKSIINHMWMEYPPQEGDHKKLNRSAYF